jgi:NAD(P)-dependent dehydrogenase (short-subunit alcohol dehydrogenase family)
VSRPRVELDGAVALVTGAGRGIGAATAVALAGRGGHVLAVDVDGRAARRTAAACVATGGTAHAYRCDVADPAAVDELAGRVEAEHGRLDVLVNNAGVGMTGELLGMTVADWQWIRGVNLDGPLLCLLAFGPLMLRQRRGHVVNVASALAFLPRATEPAYVATKSALVALSLSLRADWRRHGVGVSVVCPGVTDTGIVEETLFVGSRADEASRRRTAAAFRRGHRAEVTARAILHAIRRDRAVVSAGGDARAAWLLHRLAPVRLLGAMALVHPADGRAPRQPSRSAASTSAAKPSSSATVGSLVQTSNRSSSAP